MTDKTHKLPNLDAIRFWAAMLVFLGHSLYPVLSGQGLDKGWSGRLWQMLSSGQTGVSIFFVLSGFLITYLLLHEWEIKGRIAVGKFYMRRILRIWPLYYALFFFNFIVYPFIDGCLGNTMPTVADWRFHLLFLSNFDLLHIYLQGLTPHILMQDINWSIAIEEQFYLAWPLVFLLPKSRWLLALSMILIGALVFRICYQADITILYFHSLSNLFDLVIGGLTAYLIHYQLKIKSFFENFSTKGHILLFSLAVILICFQFDWRYIPCGEAIGHPFLALSFALLIAAQAFSKSPSLLHLGKFRFATYWGKYTYSFYLLHPIALAISDIGLRALKVNNNGLFGGLAMTLIGFGLSLLLSWLSYEFFERWFLKWREKFR